MPALAKTMSSPPKRATALRTRWATCSSSPASQRRATAAGADRGGDFIDAVGEVGGEHECAFGREQIGGGAADAGAGAGDDGDFVVEPHGARPPSPRRKPGPKNTAVAEMTRLRFLGSGFRRNDG